VFFNKFRRYFYIFTGHWRNPGWRSRKP